MSKFANGSPLRWSLSANVLSRIALAGLILAGAGCAAPQAAPKAFKGGALAPGEGILGFVVVSENAIRRIVLHGASGHVVSRDNLAGGTHLLLFRVPAGRCCFARAVFNHATIDFSHYGDDACLPAVAGAIGYMGDYVLMPGSSSQDVLRFDRPGKFRDLMGKRFPDLLGRYPFTDLLRLKTARTRPPTGRKRDLIGR